MTKMTEPPHLQAKLQFGGRFKPGVQPTGPSFRAELDLGLPGMLNMAYVELEPPPAGAVEAYASVWLLAPEFQAGRLYTGMPLKAFNGTVLIATGTITSVVDEALQHGA